MTIEPTGVELVTFALFLLGGEQRAIDTEDVAYKVNQIAPGRFNWRKYPDQINLELVRVVLSNAKKPANGQLVRGSGRRGWALTTSGLSWATNTASLPTHLSEHKARHKRFSGSIDEHRWRRERARVTTTTAWRKWLSKDQINRSDANEVFRIDAYSTGRAWHLKINRLKVLFAEDSEIGPFIHAVSRIVESGGTNEH